MLKVVYICRFFQILGLELCADTIVGDEMKRGISGGQKKRVTTGSKVSYSEVYHLLTSHK